MTTSPPPIRLAVLDSDTGFLQVLAKRLEGAGWQHRVLASPVPLDAIVAMRLNAVVLDLAVLGPQGWNYLEKLCTRLPGLGVVVCTGQSSVAQRVRGLRLGADDWVTKPCHPEELIARVEAVVRRRKRAETRSDAGPCSSARWRSGPTSSRPSSAGPAWTSPGASSSSSSCSPRRAARSCSARRSTSACGATPWSTATGRSTCSCASCGRSSSGPRPGGATSTRTSGSGTGSRPRPRMPPHRWRCRWARPRLSAPRHPLRLSSRAPPPAPAAGPAAGPASASAVPVEA